MSSRLVLLGFGSAQESGRIGQNRRAQSPATKPPILGALIAMLVLSASCGSPPPLPLDVIPTGGVDDNGFDLNPTWASQNAQGAGPFLLANPPACAPSGGAQDDPKNWYTGANACTHFHVTTNRGALCGPHVNWFPVTYQADSVAWESHSTPTVDQPLDFDDDYNIDLLRRDHALFEAGKDVGKQLYSEFDSDETIDHFKTAWWQTLHSAVDGQSRATPAALLANSKGAVAIGLLGLDCAFQHGCDVELHPIYALAIHLNDDPNDDHWAFFARNKADEGYCSGSKESLYPLNRTGDSSYTYQLLLPRADAQSLAVIKKDVRLYGKGNSIDAGLAFASNLVANKGALLSFTLPNPDQQQDSDEWVIEGEIELAWQFNHPQLTVAVTTIPSLDTGQFDVLVDGSVVAAAVPAVGTTSSRPFSVGAHKIAEQASSGTDLGAYSVAIGGDCKPDGSITLGAGDRKTCAITNTRKGPAAACVQTCKTTQDDCLSSDLTPKECSNGYAACLKGCPRR